jgi:hypothetical protein
LREVRKRLREAIASRNLDRLNDAIRHHDAEADFEIIPYYRQTVELYVIIIIIIIIILPCR